MNQSKTDLGIVNESQLLRFGISGFEAVKRRWNNPSAKFLCQSNSWATIIIANVDRCASIHD
jgi:hypothetical protein